MVHSWNGSQLGFPNCVKWRRCRRQVMSHLFSEGTWLCPDGEEEPAGGQGSNESCLSFRRMLCWIGVNRVDEKRQDYDERNPHASLHCPQLISSLHSPWLLLPRTGLELGRMWESSPRSQETPGQGFFCSRTRKSRSHRCQDLNIFSCSEQSLMHQYKTQFALGAEYSGLKSNSVTSAQSLSFSWPQFPHL